VRNAKDQAEGVDEVKNWSGKCKGPRGGGAKKLFCLKRKVFFKNQKHEPNIVEITHLCIMHGVHTSVIKQTTLSRTTPKNRQTYGVEILDSEKVCEKLWWPDSWRAR